MGFARAGIYVEDECELLDHLDTTFAALRELATVSLDEDLNRQPMSRRAAEAVFAFGDSLEEAREEVRRLDNERDEALEEALGLPELSLAGLRMGEVEVESADIELSENGGEG